MRACFWMALMLASSTATAATTYYVSPQGKDTNNGSQAAPFLTIQHAADLVNAGDTVVVKDGTYADADGDNFIVNTARGGTSSAWVTFRSEHRWGAKLDGQSNKTGYCWNFDADYVRVEGFEVFGCASGGFWSNSGHHHITLAGNHVHHHGRMCSESLYGKNGAFQGNGTSYHTYDGNVFHHNGRLHASDGCSYPAGFFHDRNHDHGIYFYGHHNTVINNVFYAHDSGWAIQLSGGTGPSDGVGWQIVNNTFAGTNPERDGHIILWTAEGGHDPTDVLIQNNISYEPRAAFINAYALSGHSSWSFKNNLVYPAGLKLASGFTTFTQSGNILDQDPLFVAAAQQDFHLKQGSPALEKGLAAGAPDHDHDGVSRPQGPGFDLGAYERPLAGTPEGGLLKDARVLDGARLDRPGGDGALEQGALADQGQRLEGPSGALGGGCGCVVSAREGSPLGAMVVALLGLLALRGSRRGGRSGGRPPTRRSSSRARRRRRRP